MDINAAVTKVRDYVYEKLPSGQVEGNWSDSQLQRYIKMAEFPYLYLKEINADSTRFVETQNLTTGTTTLPDNFYRIIGLTDSTTGNSLYAAEYLEIPYAQRDNYFANTYTGRAFYFKDNTINILPTPTGTVVMAYHRKLTPIGDGVDSELHEISQEAMCLYAAILALKDRGDANTAMFEQELARWEMMLGEIRRGSNQSRTITTKDWQAGNLEWYWRNV